MGERFDHKRLDDVIHGRARLSIMAFLSGADAADFTAIKKAVGLTDGNLSLHLRKLEDAGYISVKKSFVNRRPRTSCALTDAGRHAMLDYLNGMEALLAEIRGEKR